MNFGLRHGDLEILVSELRHLLPDIRPEHLAEAVARGLGFGSRAALEARLLAGGAECLVNEALFSHYIESRRLAIGRSGFLFDAIGRLRFGLAFGSPYIGGDENETGRPSPLRFRTMHYFDVDGRRQLPTKSEIEKDRHAGRTTAVVLDANIVLNVALFSQGKLPPEEDRRVRSFLAALKSLGLATISFLGSVELASRPNEAQLDLERLSRIERQAASAFVLDANSLYRGAKSAEVEFADSVFTNLGPVMPLLELFYACYLKLFDMRERLEKGFNTATALPAVWEFLEWVESLGCHVPLVQQVAFAVIGGARHASSLLKGKKTRPRAAWNAAWDTLHTFLIQNTLSTDEIGGARYHSIFATEDEGAAFVAEHCLLRAEIRSDGETMAKIYQVDLNFPHFRGRDKDIARVQDFLMRNQSYRIAFSAGTDEMSRRVHARLEELQ